MNAQWASASTSQGPELSGKIENWTFHSGPVIIETHQQNNPEEGEEEKDKTDFGCNTMNRDVMYCVKMKVKIGGQFEYWKVLLDTTSRLNIVSNTIVSMHL